MEGAVSVKNSNLGPTKSSLVDFILLISERSEEEELAKSFRQHGASTRSVKTLKEFWQEVLAEPPSCCVIDVRMMSDGNLVLKNHPLILSKSIHFSFYYTEEVRPLLSSTYEFLHLGLIKRAPSYEPIVNQIMKRLLYFDDLENNCQDLNLSIDKLKKEKNRLLEKINCDNQDFYNHKLCAKLVKSLNQKISRSNIFQDSVCKLLADLENIENFSLIEISPCKKKLMSTPFINEKYCELPVVYLEKYSNDGIRQYAQNIIYTAGIDMWGKDLVVLEIKGEFKNPDMLIILKCKDQKFKNTFDWSLLELFFSVQYKSQKELGNEELDKLGKYLDPWKLYSYLDNQHFGINDKKITIDMSENLKTNVIIDLRLIDRYVQENEGQRFFWSTFFKEFSSRLKKIEDIEMYICPIGVEYIVLIFDHRHLDFIYPQIKHNVKKFSFWRYFYNTDAVLNKIFDIKVSSIPFNRMAFNNFYESQRFNKSNIKNAVISFESDTSPGLRDIDV